MCRPPVVSRTRNGGSLSAAIASRTAATVRATKPLLARPITLNIYGPGKRRVLSLGAVAGSLSMVAPLLAREWTHSNTARQPAIRLPRAPPAPSSVEKRRTGASQGSAWQSRPRKRRLLISRMVTKKAFCARPAHCHPLSACPYENVMAERLLLCRGHLQFSHVTFFRRIPHVRPLETLPAVPGPSSARTPERGAAGGADGAVGVQPRPNPPCLRHRSGVV